MIKIYKLTSENTEMVYIGQTKQILCQRLAEHVYGSKNRYTMASRIILSYGNYDIEMIEEVETKDEANERELYYIDLYRQQGKCVNIGISSEIKQNDKTDFLNRYQNEVVNCECGINIKLKSYERHLKSSCHIKNLLEQ